MVYRDGSVESYVPFERLAVPRGALLAATAGEATQHCDDTVTVTLLDNYFTLTLCHNTLTPTLTPALCDHTLTLTLTLF